MRDRNVGFIFLSPIFLSRNYSAMTYPKRLIEVDLPIARISAHARREKSIRHGHISTLHIWWARRPLAACRAVICAALWPDPADPLCPQRFRDEAARLINAFAHKAATTKRLMETCSPESLARWEQIVKSGQEHAGQEYEEQKSSSHFPVPHLPVQLLRSALLDFIADFANWDNSTVKEYLETSRALTQTAHEALGGAPGTRPLVVDPFAGGGSIPLEALRVGADAFASDLNPVAVLLNKVVLEYIPKYGQRLADEVRKWGAWIKAEAEKELTLREYLEQVWAAVSTEALSMIFKEADAAGLEPDARLTAMWLWTLGAGKEDNGQKNGGQEDEGAEETEAETGGGMMTASYGLEYDAARKIAQGLGVHLEEIASVVEVKGDKARLRPVAERTKHLFGKDEAAPTATRRKRKSPQKTLFEDLDETEAAEGGWSEMKGPALGETVLDRVHQAMILFAAGRTDAIKRFLVEDSAGADARFWKLAQSLSALYPKDTDEKRWVDGVLARKKGWGL